MVRSSADLLWSSRNWHCKFWLETVEITDVKILSGSLFKNLQCQFREDQSKSAELLTMDVNNEINVEQSNYNVLEQKRRKDTQLKSLEWNLDTEYDQKKQSVEIAEQTLKINKEKEKDLTASRLYEKVNSNAYFKQSFKNNLEYTTLDVEKTIALEAEKLISQ
jgi:hypothetical protein